MKHEIIYPIIQEPNEPITITRGQRANPNRQYKKHYCRVFGITGRKYRKIQRIQRRILQSADIKV